MNRTIGVEALDVRFPTSHEPEGSDAHRPGPSRPEQP